MKFPEAVTIVILLNIFKESYAGWHLAWHDDFDGGNLEERWEFQEGCHGWGNDELQCYTRNRKENARQRNGMLIIQARREPWRDARCRRDFTSARIRTKASWLHGRFEMRARLPKGKHLWPAFWMMPQHSEYGEWPRSGEIDIMEYRGQKPNVVLGNIHFGEAWNRKGDAVGEVRKSYDFSRDFHVFTLEWNPWEITWYIDNQSFHGQTLLRNFWPRFYKRDGQPFDKHFYMILNLAVGGSFFGGEPFHPNEAGRWEKSTFEIDWVRKWEWR